MNLFTRLTFTVPTHIIIICFYRKYKERVITSDTEKIAAERTKEEKQYEKMTKTPVSRLIVSLSVPTVITMLVSALYNMADTYFVSNFVGETPAEMTSATGAVGIVFPLMAIIQAVGFTFGLGAGSWISRLLGGKENEKAQSVGSASFYVSIVIGGMITVFGLLFLTPLLRVLGATETMLPYAKAYARWILYAAPVMDASFVLNNYLRAEGKARFAMIGLCSGGILNIALDPLFIITAKMGITGAAVATVISQIVSFLILLSIFLTGKTIIRLDPRRIPKTPKTYLSIMGFGLPSFLRQGLSCAASIIMNAKSGEYGDSAVAAMTIATKILIIAFSVILGIGQGYQPVLGYNYGAHLIRRVKKAFSFTFIAGMVVMTSFGALMFFLAPQVMKLFCGNSNSVVTIGSEMLRALCIAMPFIPLCVVCNMTFQAIGKSLTSSFLSSLRQGLCYIPLIFVLSHFFGLRGLEISQAAADILTFFISVPFAAVFVNKLKKDTPHGVS
jgi:putative MATE family efflux protein